MVRLDNAGSLIFNKGTWSRYRGTSFVAQSFPCGGADPRTGRSGIKIAVVAVGRAETSLVTSMIASRRQWGSGRSATRS
jgi:hypothetical protein